MIVYITRVHLLIIVSIILFGMKLRPNEYLLTEKRNFVNLKNQLFYILCIQSCDYIVSRVYAHRMYNQCISKWFAERVPPVTLWSYITLEYITDC